MENKFNIHTVFRLVIPGYIFLLVLYSLGILNHNLLDSSALLALAGIPIGFICRAFWRIIFYIFRCQVRSDRSSREYIVNTLRLRWEEDRNKSNFTPEDNFRYAALIDYLLQTDENMKGMFSDTIRFLYTRMHSFGSSFISICFGLIWAFCFQCNSLSCKAMSV